MTKTLSFAVLSAALAGSHAAAAAPAESPFACDLSALSPAERRRHFDELGPALRALRLGVRELADGFELTFAPSADTWSKLTEWAYQERRCCPFLDIGLALDREGGPLRLRLGGRPGTKEFIKADAGAWLEAAAPDFTLPALGGGSVRLADLRGRVVVLSFWAPWCGGCKLEMPWLADLARRERGRLTVVGVAVDGSREEIERFARAHGVGFPVVFADGAVAAAYGATGSLPQTVVIGRDGAVVERVTGVRDRAALEALVARALAVP